MKALFVSFFKIGLFTFGGGYAMIPLLEEEFINKNKSLTKEEFLNMLAISESTPGPLAINSATYIGYKTKGIKGAIIANFAVVLPSFIIIYLISIFLKQIDIKGIRVAVIFLILSTGLKLLKDTKLNTYNIVILLATIILSLINTSIPSVIFIFLSGLLAIII